MINSLLHKIGVGVFTLGVAVSSFFGFHQAPQFTATPLGAAPQFTAAKPSSLYGSGISSSATSIKLTALVTPDGTAITTSQLVGGVGNVFYITIDPSTTKKETVSCTAVTQNSDGTATLTGCSRGLGFTYPYTAVVGLAISHAGGASVVLSNSPQLYNDIISYVNASLASGVNDASLIAKGIVQVSTGKQAASSTPIGGGSTSAPLALTSGIATSSCNGVTSPLNALISDNAGYLANNCINPTINNAHTYTATSTYSAAGIVIPNAANILDSSGFAPLWSFIASTSLAAPAQALTLSNLPNRRHLHVIAYLDQDTGSGRTDPNTLTFNGDTAINYSYYSASSTMNSSVSGANGIVFRDSQSNVAAPTYAIIDIYNFSTTTKTVMIQYGDTLMSTSTTNYGVNNMIGLWATTTPQAINQIKITKSTANYTTNAAVYVYGSSF